MQQSMACLRVEAHSLQMPRSSQPEAAPLSEAGHLVAASAGATATAYRTRACWRPQL